MELGLTGSPSHTHSLPRGCLTQQLLPLCFLPSCLPHSQIQHPQNSCGAVRNPATFQPEGRSLRPVSAVTYQQDNLSGDQFPRLQSGDDATYFRCCWEDSMT